MSRETTLVEPTIARSVEAARTAVGAAREAGQRIGLVPTMGALHEGHLSLIDHARHSCDFVVVTIFVNPTQFGPRDDFSRYPRTWEADLEFIRERRSQLVFAPSAEEMYSACHSTVVCPPKVAETLEGEFRPGHFTGVTTVVLKLMQIVAADVAFFGEKDFQQCLVIRDMVRDLNVPVEVNCCPTIREPDGLAMSSRNQYLSPDDRQQALSLNRGLELAKSMVARGEREGSAIEAAVRACIEASGAGSIDYVAIRDSDQLGFMDVLDRPAVLLLAVHVGSARLIDNTRLDV